MSSLWLFFQGFFWWGLGSVVAYFLCTKWRNNATRATWQAGFSAGLLAGTRAASGLCPCMRCTMAGEMAEGQCARFLQLRQGQAQKDRPS